MSKQDDFNQNFIVTEAGTTFSDNYVIDPNNAQLFFEAIVTALAGTDSPSLTITPQFSRDAKNWVDATQELAAFTTTGTDSNRVALPLRYARLKVVAAGTTITAEIDLFMQAMDWGLFNVLDDGSVVLAGYDQSSNGLNTNNNSPDWSHNQDPSVVFTDVLNGTPATFTVDMENYPNGVSFVFKKTGGSDTHAITILAGNEGTGATDETIEVTTLGANIAGGSLTGDVFIHTNEGLNAKAVTFVLTTAGGAHDLDGELFAFKR